jgi:hypothetical protein
MTMGSTCSNWTGRPRSTRSTHHLCFSPVQQRGLWICCRCNVIFYLVIAHCAPQSTHLHRVTTGTVFVPSLELGPSQPLFRKASVPSHRNQRGGGAHAPAGKGLGESQLRRLEKKLSTLSTLKGGTSLYQHCSCQQWISASVMSPDLKPGSIFR